jgi:ferric enterobactin receptor
MKGIFIVFFCLSILFPVLAQQGKVTGKVADVQGEGPLAFSSVRILDKISKKLVGGGLSDEQGKFTIAVPFGTYVASIEYVGYKAFETEAFELSKSSANYDFGVLKISGSSKSLDEVEVRAEKSSMELSLDKRVFNVGKDLANTGGNASDVLMNIPSVQVDPEGGVKLRGSDNVRILIDGKPSGLVSFKGGSGLQTLQANMIEKVEVITNPSARYEAEGMAGIINIILKKDKNQGFNASIEAVAGNPTNYGLGANLNYRHRKVNFFVNYGLTYRVSPNVSFLEQSVFDANSVRLSTQEREGTLEGFNNNIRGGLDYYFSEKDILTASYLFKRSDAHRITDIVYTDYLGSKANKTLSTFRQQDETEDEPNSEYTLSYKKEFAKKGQGLSAEVKFIDNWERSNQLFTQNAFLTNGNPESAESLVQNSLNDEFEKNWIYQLDYQQPIGKDGRFETGIRTSFRDMVNDYVVNQKNNNGIFEPLPGLINYFIYNENISALYGIYGNKKKHWSYQLGLRAENTDVKTTLRQTNQTNPRQYLNLFPSAHLSYELTKNNSFQLSYSKRVRRPFYNDLSPFSTFADSRNFFSGNPNLDPEFTDAFEIGHLNYFAKGSFSSSVYYRNTKDKIQTLRLVDSRGFATTQPKNLNGEQALGAEFTSQLTASKWWRMDATVNFFKANIDGTNLDESYLKELYSWFARYSTRFSLPQDLDLQLRANYEARQKTVQGIRLPLYYFDLSGSKDILNRKATITLNATDIFNTRKLRQKTEGDNFISEGWGQFRRRQVNLSFSYRINQVKNTRKNKTLIEE